MNEKPWYKSRVLWLNAVAAALIVVEAQWSMMQPFLPVNFYAAMAVVLPIANAALRVITTAALTAGPGAAKAVD